MILNYQDSKKQLIKDIDTFIQKADNLYNIYNTEEKLVILTSIGRLFKFDLSNQYISPSSKQSQGLLLVNFLMVTLLAFSFANLRLFSDF